MFRKMFGLGNASAEDKLSPQGEPNPAVEAIKHVIEEKRKSDPLIGAKMGAKAVTQHLITVMKNEKGVHIESLLCALGSLAGYACQASVRAEFIDEKKQPENKVFTIVSGANGKKYYFGDTVNKPLAESQYSVWSLAAGAAQQLGIKGMVDVADIFRHVSSTVGSESFGVPRIPNDHKPTDSPITYVRVIWPKILPAVKQYCAKPDEWPILFGLAIQDVLIMGKSVIDPALALTVVMESAIPMSKVNLAEE